MIKQLVILFFCITSSIFCNEALAQTLYTNKKSDLKDTLEKLHLPNNTLRFSFGDFIIPRMLHHDKPVSQFGVHFERRCYKQIYIGIGYAQWGSFINKAVKAIYEKSSVTDTTVTIGELIQMYDYKMLDVYASYKFSLFKNKHFLNAGVGASYTWGNNSYLETYTVYLFEKHITAVQKKLNHYGALANISYDYHFLKNRFVTGANIRGRFYNWSIAPQFDFGLHVGVNF